MSIFIKWNFPIYRLPLKFPAGTQGSRVGEQTSNKTRAREEEGYWRASYLPKLRSLPGSDCSEPCAHTSPLQQEARTGQDQRARERLAREKPKKEGDLESKPRGHD